MSIRDSGELESNRNPRVVILQVGGDPTMNNVVMVLLRGKWGESSVTFLSAEGLDDALDIVKEEPVDLVITAVIGMNGGTGVELAKKIWSWERTRSLPVIFHTCWLCQELEVAGIELDKDPFNWIGKPASPGWIVKIVEDTLRLHGIPVPARSD